MTQRFKAAEESKLKVLTEHMKIQQCEIEDKQKVKQAAKKKKVVDDTKKLESSVAMFHGSTKKRGKSIIYLLPQGDGLNSARDLPTWTGRDHTVWSPAAA
jgi:hypothetical protein